MTWTAEEFRAWQLALGLSNPQAAAVLEIGLRTLVEYRMGRRPVPGPVRMAAEYQALCRRLATSA